MCYSLAPSAHHRCGCRWEGVDASKLGTTTRKDGSVQVTYNGWPLYYYQQDKSPGDVTGQDVGGVWYAVSAAGDKVTTP